MLAGLGGGKFKSSLPGAGRRPLCPGGGGGGDGRASSWRAGLGDGEGTESSPIMVRSSSSTLPIVPSMLT